MSSSSTEPLTARDELAITRAMLYGCMFEYNDYGHPERAQARKYHTCFGPWHESLPHENGSRTRQLGYGYTQAEAALDWLRRSGLQGDLNVRKRA